MLGGYRRLLLLHLLLVLPSLCELLHRHPRRQVIRMGRSLHLFWNTHMGLRW